MDQQRQSLSSAATAAAALNIEAGGQVSNATGYLGYSSGSSGTATVTGAGSKWTNNSYLYVGYSGKGTLSITDGSGRPKLGHQPISAVHRRGRGSLLTVADTMPN